MSPPAQGSYVSRGGEKLAAALDCFRVDVAGRICADFGSHVGGFVDCLLQRGVLRVYSIDTSYGTLAWKLRRDPRVAVLERTNAIHAVLPVQVELISIDVGWTPQEKILPSAASLLSPAGEVVTLIKPHYESPPDLLEEGVLPEAKLGEVIETVLVRIRKLGWTIKNTMQSPILGHGGNREVFAHLTRP